MRYVSSEFFYRNRPNLAPLASAGATGITLTDTCFDQPEVLHRRRSSSLLWIAPLLLLVVGACVALSSAAEPAPPDAPVPGRSRAAPGSASTRVGAPSHSASLGTAGPPLSYYLGPIVERNIFDSTPPKSSESPAAEADLIVASELKAQLISTSVATDPAWSTALVRAAPKESSQILRIGEHLQDGVVHEILRPRFGPAGKLLPARIVIERSGRLEYIDEDNKPAPKPKKKKKRKRRKRRKRSRKR